MKASLASLFVTVIIAIAGRFMSDEVKQWFEWLHRMIRKRAVKSLPEPLRERYNEEWESSLEEAPGEIAKLIYSLGLLKAAAGIRLSSPARRTEVDRFRWLAV